MASEIAARVQAMYKTFDLDNFHPDCEWHLRADVPDSRILRGHRDIAQNAASWYEAFDDLVLEPVEMSEAAGKIIVAVHFSGRIKGTGEEVNMDEVHVVTMRDDKIIEIREYNAKDEALRSLGLAA